VTGLSPHDPPAEFLDGKDLEELFGAAPTADTCSAVLTEARMVLPRLSGPFEAEVWGSDVVAALERSPETAAAMAPAAESAGTAAALALLVLLGVLGGDDIRDGARAAAARLRAGGAAAPPWSTQVGRPSVGECWRYGDSGDQLDAVTMTFRYGPAAHVISVLVDHGQGGAISNLWAGEAGGVLDQTREMAREEPGMTFAMLPPAEARARVEKAMASGECPSLPEEARSVASLWPLLRARVLRLPLP
jgi:hypothetical protein